jgi:hypothetical protein
MTMLNHPMSRSRGFSLQSNAIDAILMITMAFVLAGGVIIATANSGKETAAGVAATQTPDSGKNEYTTTGVVAD